MKISLRNRPTSTLIDASSATNFIYSVDGASIDDTFVQEFNNTKKFVDKFRLLKKHNNYLTFQKTSNKIFNTNLQGIDGGFARVLGEMLVLYYTGEIENKLKNYIDEVAKLNPSNFDIATNDKLYELNLKDYLTRHALGMQASEKWLGKYETTGGYIVVKADGNIVCYHFYYTEQFQDYLLANTKFETASTTRHNFGNIYNDGNGYFINLNLQVRFII